MQKQITVFKRSDRKDVRNYSQWSAMNSVITIPRPQLFPIFSPIVLQSEPRKRDATRTGDEEIKRLVTFIVEAGMVRVKVSSGSGAELLKRFVA